MDEEFPYQQKLMPLLLAQKKNWKKLAFCVAITLEKGLLIFGREEIPYFDKK
jgi:hypothetical protein